jgi:DNA/RNA-binding domain of Phe-tRNA-synthetase-like protein
MTQGLAIKLEPHPLLDVGAFVLRSARPCGELATPDAIAALGDPDRAAGAPLTSSEAVKAAIRDLLRHGGYKPSGRSKPASEYLAAAFAKREFPRINALVDACNVVSLHSGLPISLVDVDRLTPGGLTIQIAPAATSYVFNPSGQVIDASGLVCLYDPDGPTGTPVKDAQRTKTHDATVATLAIVWGTRALAGRTADTTRWYRALAATIPDMTVDDVALG